MGCVTVRHLRRQYIFHFPYSGFFFVPSKRTQKRPRFTSSVSQMLLLTPLLAVHAVFLMGPKRECAQVTRQLLLFILLKTKHVLFKSPNKELQCCYEEQDDVILFREPDVTCSSQQTERTDDTSCDALCR